MKNKIIIILLLVTNILTLGYLKNKMDILEECILIQGDNIDIIYDDILTIEKARKLKESQ